MKTRKNYKVSVIVPIYNVGNFLEKCVASVIAQTHGNLEIILVNDGSTDNSAEICAHFAAQDKRVLVIRQENAGVSAARNSGLSAATGDYVCFVDGDDFVMPDYVEYLLNMALQYKAEIALSLTMSSNWDERQVNHDKVELWTPEQAAEKMLCYHVPIGCYAKLFKRSFLETGIRFLPYITIGEGFNFNMDAFQRAGRIAAGRRRIYYYRKDNPNSAMTKFSVEKCQCGLQALEIIKQRMILHSPQLDMAWKFADWRTHTDFYDMFVLAHTEKIYPELYGKCRLVTQRDALIAFRVPTSLKNRVRALVMRICPPLIPFAMRIRKFRHHVK